MALVDQLTAWYDFEEASGIRQDAHGLYPFSESGVGVGQTGGQIGNAAHFDGESWLYMLPEDATGLQIGTSDYSVAFWLRPVPDDGYQRIFALPLVFTVTCIDGTTLSVSLSGSDTSTNWGGNDLDIGDGNYHLVVVTLDRDGQGSTYLDNELVASTSINPLEGEDIQTDFGGPTIGTSDQWGGFAFERLAGGLDSLGVWGRLLTQEDRDALWNKGAGVSYPDIAETATAYTISGVVTGRDSAPIEGADVQLFDEDGTRLNTGRSAADGTYSLEALFNDSALPRDVSVRTEVFGFAPQERSVTLSTDASEYALDFELVGATVLAPRSTNLEMEVTQPRLIRQSNHRGIQVRWPRSFTDARIVVTRPNGTRSAAGYAEGRPEFVLAAAADYQDSGQALARKQAVHEAGDALVFTDCSVSSVRPSDRVEVQNQDRTLHGIVQGTDELDSSILISVDP